MSMPEAVRVIDSPVGLLTLTAARGHLTRIEFGRTAEPSGHAPVMDDAIRQLEEYFAGRRHHFELPLSPAGTAFQRRVWAALDRIPYGHTWSYKQLATAVGNSRAGQAVGQANGANPLPIVIPCHRVIAANGGLGGYGGGDRCKRRLLAIEGVEVP